MWNRHEVYSLKQWDSRPVSAVIMLTQKQFINQFSQTFDKIGRMYQRIALHKLKKKKAWLRILLMSYWEYIRRYNEMVWCSMIDYRKLYQSKNIGNHGKHLFLKAKSVYLQMGTSRTEWSVHSASWSQRSHLSSYRKDSYSLLSSSSPARVHLQESSSNYSPQRRTWTTVIFRISV